MNKGLIILLVLAGAEVAEAQPAEVAEGAARERAEDAYDTAFILLEDEYAAHIQVQAYGDMAYGTVRTVRNAVPIRGIQRERLNPVAFYDAVGRSDLAADYQSGRRKQLVVGGVSVGAFGLSVMSAGIAFAKVFGGPDDSHCDVFSPTWRMCLDAADREFDRKEDEARNWAIGVGILFLGGLTFGAIYRYSDPHPVSESERRMLAHDHNGRLRRELRLPRRRALSVALFATADVGGLMAAGTF